MVVIQQKNIYKTIIMKRIATISLTLFLLLQVVCSYSQVVNAPKHEFRAVWVATVDNIDWPTKKNLSSEEQIKEIIETLDMNKKLGMNAIILQIRPTSDALYQSNFEPWSRYLTGQAGKKPYPYYDPLKIWVEETHKRGMELHAWLNPYRINISEKELLPANHVAFKHPEWIIKYGKKLYFDPAVPAARTFVKDVVKDIVVNYDIDAIHFDDYFYPYPLKHDFPDTLSFKLYGKGYTQETKEDWRRENVDILIKTLNDTIKSIKPWVKFGISPFGVWRNIADDPTGSNSKAGITNYDHLYADIIKWQKNGWIDYTLPQLYWRIGHPLVDFKTLADWWSKHAYGRAMYVGHGIYKINKESKYDAWNQPGEHHRQIEYIRNIDKIDGSAFFSSKWFKRDLLGLQDQLQFNIYKQPAIVPPMPWISKEKPLPVINLRKSWGKIKWDTLPTNNEMKKARQFVIYLNEVGEKFDASQGKFIKTIVPHDKIKIKRINKKRKKYELRVSALNRLSNESQISQPIIIKL